MSATCVSVDETDLNATHSGLSVPGERRDAAWPSRRSTSQHRIRHGRMGEHIIKQRYSISANLITDYQETLGSLSNGATLCIRGKSSKEWKDVLRKVDVVICAYKLFREV